MTQNTSILDLAALNQMGRDDFVGALGSTFEHSPWVAEGAWLARPFASVQALHSAMMDVVHRSSEDTQIAFLCGHPELAGKEAAAGTMTRDSVGEQASAGLDALSRDEVVELRALNRRYRERHGFPFIVAVRNYSKLEIFELLRSRVNNDSEAELDEALRQIGLITRMRVQNKLSSPAGRVRPTPALPKVTNKVDSEDIAKPELAHPLTL